MAEAEESVGKRVEVEVGHVVGGGMMAEAEESVGNLLSENSGVAHRVLP